MSSDSLKNKMEEIHEQKHVKHELPPNWEDIVERFPVVKEALDAHGNLRVVFTYAPYIYVPGGQRLHPDIYVHETIHLKQQGENPALWWDSYLKDDAFRLEQELQAYGAQLAMFNESGNRVFEYMKDRLAQDLSSVFYGKIISFGEAASKIRRIAKSIVHEKN